MSVSPRNRHHQQQQQPRRQSIPVLSSWNRMRNSIHVPEGVNVTTNSSYGRRPSNSPSPQTPGYYPSAQVINGHQSASASMSTYSDGIYGSGGGAVPRMQPVAGRRHSTSSVAMPPSRHHHSNGSMQPAPLTQRSVDRHASSQVIPTITPAAKYKQQPTSSSSVPSAYRNAVRDLNPVLINSSNGSAQPSGVWMGNTPPASMQERAYREHKDALGNTAETQPPAPRPNSSDYYVEYYYSERVSAAPPSRPLHQSMPVLSGRGGGGGGEYLALEAPIRGAPLTPQSFPRRDVRQLPRRSSTNTVPAVLPLTMLSSTTRTHVVRSALSSTSVSPSHPYSNSVPPADASSAYRRRPYQHASEPVSYEPSVVLAPPPPQQAQPPPSLYRSNLSQYDARPADVSTHSAMVHEPQYSPIDKNHISPHNAFPPPTHNNSDINGAYPEQPNNGRRLSWHRLAPFFPGIAFDPSQKSDAEMLREVATHMAQKEIMTRRREEPSPRTVDAYTEPPPHPQPRQDLGRVPMVETRLPPPQPQPQPEPQHQPPQREDPLRSATLQDGERCEAPQEEQPRIGRPGEELMSPSSSSAAPKQPRAISEDRPLPREEEHMVMPQPPPAPAALRETPGIASVPHSVMRAAVVQHEQGNMDTGASEPALTLPIAEMYEPPAFKSGGEEEEDAVRQEPSPSPQEEDINVEDYDAPVVNEDHDDASNGSAPRAVQTLHDEECHEEEDATPLCDGHPLQTDDLHHDMEEAAMAPVTHLRAPQEETSPLQHEEVPERTAEFFSNLLPQPPVLESIDEPEDQPEAAAQHPPHADIPPPTIVENTTEFASADFPHKGHSQEEPEHEERLDDEELPRLEADEEKRREAEEAARVAAEEEEYRQAEEVARLADEENERRQAEEAARVAAEEEEYRQAEEVARLADEENERRQAEEAARVAAEEEEYRQAEEVARLADEEEERRQAEEAARLAAEEQERREAEEAARLAAEEQERREAEEAARLADEEQERHEAEEAARLAAEEQERHEAEEAARLAAEEQERREAEEAARLAAEEQERREAEEAARLAAEEQERREAEEAARLAAEEQERREAEEIARLADEEEERRQAEEVARLADEEEERGRREVEEMSRIAAQEQERSLAKEVARLAAEDKERRQAEEVARVAEESRMKSERDTRQSTRASRPNGRRPMPPGAALTQVREDGFVYFVSLEDQYVRVDEKTGEEMEDNLHNVEVSVRNRLKKKRFYVTKGVYPEVLPLLRFPDTERLETFPLTNQGFQNICAAVYLRRFSMVSTRKIMAAVGFSTHTECVGKVEERYTMPEFNMSSPLLKKLDEICAHFVRKHVEQDVTGSPEKSRMSFPERCVRLWDGDNLCCWPKDLWLQLPSDSFPEHVTSFLMDCMAPKEASSRQKALQAKRRELPVLGADRSAWNLFLGIPQENTSVVHALPRIVAQVAYSFASRARNYNLSGGLGTLFFSILTQQLPESAFFDSLVMLEKLRLSLSHSSFLVHTPDSSVAARAKNSPADASVAASSRGGAVEAPELRRVARQIASFFRSKSRRSLRLIFTALIEDMVEMGHLVPHGGDFALWCRAVVESLVSVATRRDAEILPSERLETYEDTQDEAVNPTVYGSPIDPAVAADIIDASTMVQILTTPVRVDRLFAYRKFPDMDGVPNYGHKSRMVEVIRLQYATELLTYTMSRQEVILYAANEGGPNATVGSILDALYASDASKPVAEIENYLKHLLLLHFEANGFDVSILESMFVTIEDFGRVCDQYDVPVQELAALCPRVLSRRTGRL